MKHALGALGAVLLIGSAALSHEGPTGVVKQRMDEMEHVGRIVKRINERLKSKRGLADIMRDAEEIRAAATRIPSLFRPGTRDGHSDAKPAVWERWPPRGLSCNRPRSSPALPDPGRNPLSQRSSTP